MVQVLDTARLAGSRTDEGEWWRGARSMASKLWNVVWITTRPLARQRMPVPAKQLNGQA